MELRSWDGNVIGGAGARVCSETAVAAAAADNGRVGNVVKARAVLLLLLVVAATEPASNSRCLSWKSQRAAPNVTDMKAVVEHGGAGSCSSSSLGEAIVRAASRKDARQALRGAQGDGDALVNMFELARYLLMNRDKGRDGGRGERRGVVLRVGGWLSRGSGACYGLCCWF